MLELVRVLEQGPELAQVLEQGPELAQVLERALVWEQVRALVLEQVQVQAQMQVLAQELVLAQVREPVRTVPKQGQARGAAFTPHLGTLASDLGRLTSRQMTPVMRRFLTRKLSTRIRSIQVEHHASLSGRPTIGIRHCVSGRCLSTRS